MPSQNPEEVRRDVSSLAVVNWWYPDGSTVASVPLEVTVAEALAKAYLERYPDRRSWLSTPAPITLPRGARAHRTSRSRAPALAP